MEAYDWVSYGTKGQKGDRMTTCWLQYEEDLSIRLYRTVNSEAVFSGINQANTIAFLTTTKNHFLPWLVLLLLSFKRCSLLRCVMCFDLGL